MADKVRRVVHHLLLSHELTVNSCHSGGHGRVGIAVNSPSGVCRLRTEQDLETHGLHDVFQNRWFLGLLFTDTYPAVLDEIFPGTGDDE